MKKLTIRTLIAAAFFALGFSTPALATVQPYTLQAFNPTASGAIVLPGATVTIYLYGTTTKATLYALSSGTCSGSTLSNPMTADANGMVNFCADPGSQYQAVWGLGSYTSPTVNFATNYGPIFSTNNTWTGSNTFNGSASFNGGLSWTGALSSVTAGGGVLWSFGLPGSSGHSTSTPDAIDLGNDYSSANGANPKLIIYHDNVGQSGIGYASDGIDIISSSAINFWVSSSKLVTISGTSLSNGVLSVLSTVGSTSPTTGALAVAGGAGISGSAYVGGSVVGSGSITAATYLLNSANAPTVSSCGSSPTAAGTSGNNGGYFTLGTGTVTSCTVTFGTAYPTAAFCTVTPFGNYTGTMYVSHIGGDSTGKTGFVLNLSTNGAGIAFNYDCIGN